MAAAVDFIHDEELVDALLDYLGNASTGKLPAAWRTGTNPVLKLQTLEFGEPSWEALAHEEDGAEHGPWELMPALFVHLRRTAVSGGGMGGKKDAAHPLRLVHVRWYDAVNLEQDQCRATTSAGNVATATHINPVRAQAHYAKIVSKALAAALQAMIAVPFAFTTTDTEAHLCGAEARGPSYEGERLPPRPVGSGPVAFFLDVDVTTFTQ